MSEEGMKDTANHLIHIGRPIEVDEEEFQSGLDALAGVVADEGKKPEDVRAVVKRIVPTYAYNKSLHTLLLFLLIFVEFIQL